MNFPLLPKFSGRDNTQKQTDRESALLRREASIGGGLFGPVPSGHRRDFFCLDEHTWIWHEAWTDNGKQRAITTRYDVRTNGVIKSQNGQAHQRLSRDEARNLYQAVELYRQRVGADYQQLLQNA